jgi:hypothetical protein
MNSKAFLVLFFNVATLLAVNGLGSLTTVAYNGALSIPLLAATSGTFGTAIAVLGVLKLGAAALLLASTLNEEEEAGYGYKRRRHQRAAEGISSSPDALFALVRSMDMYECGKSLVCELEAKKEGELLEDEALIMSLFSDRKTKKIVNPGSAKAEYDLAAELGLATKDQVICRQRYASCPYTGDEMMKALRQAHL